MENTTLLRRALLGNACFCVLSGTTLLLAAARVETATGLGPRWLLMAVGGGLLLFAAGLAVDARRDPISLPRARITVAMDLGWVVGTGGLLATVELSRPGFWTLLGVAEIVLAFAAVQAYGVKKACGPIRNRATATGS